MDAPLSHRKRCTWRSTSSVICPFILGLPDIATSPKTPLIMPHIYIVKAYILCRRDAQGAGSGVCELTHQSGLSDDRS